MSGHSGPLLPLLPLMGDYSVDLHIKQSTGSSRQNCQVLNVTLIETHMHKSRLKEDRDFGEMFFFSNHKRRHSLGST